jgi:uncharacterized RDD family membrane protein YckC
VGDSAPQASRARIACTNHPAVTQGIVRCVRCRRPFCANCVVRLRGLVYCAECKTEQVRDIQSGTVAGELDLASPGRRFSALWIDSILFALPYGIGLAFVIPFVTRSFPRDSATVQYAFWFGMAGLAVVWVLYEGAMLQSRGQTLGKMALGIKVVTPDGNPISGGQAWGRAVLRQVFFSYASLINYLPVFFTKQRTCIHDIVVKTRVVRIRR